MIMGGIKSGPSEKRLASQFIARFFRHFPALSDDSLDAIFDLCEDEDTSVRSMRVNIALETILLFMLQLTNCSSASTGKNAPIIL